MMGGKPACPLLPDYAREYTRWPFPPQGAPISVSPGCSLYKHPWKGVWNKEQPLPHLQDVQKHERPMENSFPTVQSQGRSAYWSER